jgi:AraC family transcriptional activator FtrA
MTTTPRHDSRHQVIALVSSGQPAFELACAAEVFGVVRPALEPRYEFGVCAEIPGPVTTTAGYSIHVADGIDALRRADTVVVPGRPADEPVTPAVREAVCAAHQRGARVVAICSGAFLLAELGLLDGRRATTHWRMADELALRHPSVQVAPDVLYVDHGDVATSAGSAAGIDLCLHLVRSDFGAAYAAQVARHMVMPPHREGGQLQYAVKPTTRRSNASLAPVLAWASERLDQRLSADALASRVGVSVRTLNRRFAAEVGVSPTQWLLSQRIALACQLLETTHLSVEAIATRAGLSSAANLRRRFQRLVGTTPGAYRRTFATSAGT